MSNKLKSFYQVLFSNIFVLVLGILSSFLIPKQLGPIDFGYWQTYVLYSSYVGLLIFGFCDGIYLRFAGIDFNNLDKIKFSGFFFILLIFLMIISLSGIVIFLVSSISNEVSYIFIGFLITLLLQNINSYFILINQATSRFKIYSIGNSLEKVFQILFFLFLIISYSVSFKNLIIITLISKLIVLLFNIISSRDMFTNNVKFNKSLFKEAIMNIKVGLPLTMVGVISMLLTGVSKFFVEYYFDKEQFGYYAFSFTVMALIIQAIVAVSIFLFPTLKKFPDEDLINFIDKIENVFVFITTIILLSYYPIRLIIINFLPQFETSIKYITILYPLLIFQFKVSSLYNTIYKIKRFEKTLLMNGVFTIFVCILLTYILFNYTNSINGVAFATLITYSIYYFINKFLYSKKMNIKFKFMIWEIILIIAFIIFNLNITFPLSLVYFLVLCIVVLLINYIKVKNGFIYIYNFFKPE